MPNQTWIALFRGINVGGKNRLPMAQLKSELESLGLTNVRTYIQSGNVVFDSTAVMETSSLAESITARIEEQYGFGPHVLILHHRDIVTAVEANPFPEATSDPKALHFSFLAEPATSPDLEVLAQIKAPTERFELIDRVFYLHAPNGIGRSKLAGKVEKCLGVVATARNYRTVDKLLSMASPT